MEWTRVMEWVRVWGNKPGQMSWLGFEGTSRVKESLRLMERVRPNELVRVWWKELVRVWWNQWARVDGMNEWMNTLRWKSWSRLMCWSRLMEQVRVMCWSGWWNKSGVMCWSGWWNKSGWWMWEWKQQLRATEDYLAESDGRHSRETLEESMEKWEEWRATL